MSNLQIKIDWKIKALMSWNKSKEFMLWYVIAIEDHILL